MRHMARTFASLAVATLAGACKQSAPPSAPPPPEVAVVKVEASRVPTAYEFTGEVQPYRRVQVRSRVDGIVEARPFTEGSTVKAGQVLYRIDRVRPEAAYRSALARYQVAKRTLERIEPLGHLDITRAGSPARRVWFYRCRNQTRPFPFAAESEEAPSLAQADRVGAAR